MSLIEEVTRERHTLIAPKLAQLASELVGGSFVDRNVGVLGAAFKPDSDDVRDSPGSGRHGP